MNLNKKIKLTIILTLLGVLLTSSIVTTFGATSQTFSIYGKTIGDGHIFVSQGGSGNYFTITKGTNRNGGSAISISSILLDWSTWTSGVSTPLLDCVTVAISLEDVTTRNMVHYYFYVHSGFMQAPWDLSGTVSSGTFLKMWGTPGGECRIWVTTLIVFADGGIYIYYANHIFTTTFLNVLPPPPLLF